MTMILKNKCFVVSCQSEGDDPFNTPMGVSLFARAAEMVGAITQGINADPLNI